MNKTEVIALIQTAIANPSQGNFSAAFARGREELGFDDNKLATILQVSRLTIARWVAGETTPAKIVQAATLKWMLHELRRVGLREIVQELGEHNG